MPCPILDAHQIPKHDSVVLQLSIYIYIYIYIFITQHLMAMPMFLTIIGCMKALIEIMPSKRRLFIFRVLGWDARSGRGVLEGL